MKTCGAGKRGGAGWTGALALLLVLLLSGCGRGAANLDRRDEEHPLLRRALARKRAHDIDGAIQLYEAALERRSDLARAHLELGILHDEGYKEDYLRAIYHFQRYLELRPDAEKKDMVQDMIRWAKISFAASLPETPSGAVEMIARLKHENEGLRVQLSRLQGDSTGPAPPTPAPAPEVRPEPRPAPTPPAPAPTPTPETAPGPRQYTVRAGDTLSSIARRMYGQAALWERIYNANRDKLTTPQSLRVGLILTIPPES